jgi:hypothetical protein
MLELLVIVVVGLESDKYKRESEGTSLGIYTHPAKTDPFIRLQVKGICWSQQHLNIKFPHTDTFPHCAFCGARLVCLGV